MAKHDDIEKSVLMDSSSSSGSGSVSSNKTGMIVFGVVSGLIVSMILGIIIWRVKKSDATTYPINHFSK